MPIILDLSVVAIFALCVFLGYKKGLAGCLLNILSFVLAIIIAAVLYKPVTNYIVDHTQIDENLEKSIVQMLEGEVDEQGKIKAEESNLPKDMVTYINDSVTNTVNDAKHSSIEASAHQITMTIISAGVAIIVFILAKIILLIVKIFTKFITDIPIIKQVNALGGILYGILEALLIIWILLAILSFIGPMIEQTGIMEVVNKSVIGNGLYQNNLLLKIVFK